MDKNNVRGAAMKNLGSNFSGYEGQPFADAEIRGRYIGLNDPSLQFTGGSSSFMDENKSGKTYAITITNTGAAAVDRILALHPGFLTDVADIKDPNGTSVAAIVSDGTVINTADATVVCSGKPGKIAHFKEFVNRNPTRFTGMKMLVNDSDQFEETLYMSRITPFGGLGYDQIVPGAYKNATQTDDKRVEIPLQNFQLDNQTTIVFTLKAGRSVTFTFFLGAIKNSAAELAAKASIANTGTVAKYL